jgi:cytochrome c biogenesis factor
MTVVLGIGAALCVAGGMVLVFARDWVWSIDKRDEAHPRDENGEPLRTAAWDRNHMIMGWLMLGVGLALGSWVLLG